MTLKQLGEQAGVMDCCAVNNAILWFQKRLKGDPGLAELLALAHSQMSKVPGLLLKPESAR
jgi:hypothetical protein